MLDENFKIQQKHCNETWRYGLLTGKEQRGNLYTNLEFLEETNLITPESKVLEIGCGIGTIAWELTKKRCNVIGTDISSVAIEHGQNKYPDICLEVQAAEDLPYEDGSFDIVLSFDLLEHIAEVDKHLVQVGRLLKNKGYYLFQTPNKFSNTIFETLKTHSLRWREYHPSLHSASELKARLTKHGFEVNFVKMNTVNEFTLKKLGRFAFLARRLDTRKLPLSLQTNLYVIAQKKQDEFSEITCES